MYSGVPKAGSRVYDASNPDSFVHIGNPVTDTPALPPGIEPKHLALLANKAMITRTRIVLTARDATPEALVRSLQEQVCAEEIKSEDIGGEETAAKDEKKSKKEKKNAEGPMRHNRPPQNAGLTSRRNQRTCIR